MDKYLITFSLTKPKKLLESYNGVVETLESLGECVKFHKSSFFLLTQYKKAHVLDKLEASVGSGRILVVDMSDSDWSCFLDDNDPDKKYLMKWMKENI